MNKYLEKIAAQKKKGKLPLHKGPKPLKPLKKPKQEFVHLTSKAKIKLPSSGAKNGKHKS